MNPPVRLPNIAMRDQIFTLRCVERTLINDRESKGGGWGSAREQIERAQTHLSKETNQWTALPFGTLLAQFDVASWYAGMLVGLVKSLKLCS